VDGGGKVVIESFQLKNCYFRKIAALQHNTSSKG
jgi:hypothetical protein